MEERRINQRLSKEEIAELALAIIEAQGCPANHVCRFPRVNENDLESVIRIHHDVSDDDLREAIKFFKNFNKAMSETGRTVRSLIITVGFGAIVSLIIIGIISEIKTKLNI